MLESITMDLFAKKHQLRTLWKRTYKYSFLHSPCLFDDEDDTVYVSDGLGATYSGMRLRKISLSTGEEIASALTRNMSRATFDGPDYVFTWTDSRLLRLRRSDLSLDFSVEKGLPGNITSIIRHSQDLLLIMAGQYLHEWNSATQSSKKIKVGPDVFLLDSQQGSPLLLSRSTGELTRFSLENRSSTAVSVLGPINRFQFDSRTQTLYYASGRALHQTENSITRLAAPRELKYLKLADLESGTFKLPRSYEHFKIVDPLTSIWLEDEPVSYLCNLLQSKVQWKVHWPQGWRMLEAFPGRRQLLFVSIHEPELQLCQIEE